MRKRYLLILPITFLLTTCQTTKNRVLMQEVTVQKAVNKAIIYKTIHNYNLLVPVIMNEDRTKIISYPDPSDIYYQGKLSVPAQLANGYLLDNRGINENVAFLSFTYQEYSKLKEAPPMSILLSRIVDKYPLKALVYCGERAQYQQDVKELNKLIKSGLIGCKRVL